MLFKIVFDGYIIGVGIGPSGQEITQEEYDHLTQVFHDKPLATETTDYRLREDLTWEEYPVEPEDPDNSDDAEAYAIIFGGGNK